MKIDGFFRTESYISPCRWPLVTGGGLTQHTEPFTQNDFWVTTSSSVQFAARGIAKVRSRRPDSSRQKTLWYKGSIHHDPRDEDGVYRAPRQKNWVETAHLMWTRFALVPHNVFDCSPFYQPCPTPP
jgi:hypothetical protein